MNRNALFKLIALSLAVFSQAHAIRWFVVLSDFFSNTIGGLARVLVFFELGLCYLHVLYVCAACKYHSYVCVC